MIDPEKFQQIINNLNEMDLQILNRCLACEAMIRALVALVPQHQLEFLREEYEAGILEFAQQLVPQYQRPEHWRNWTKILDEREASLSRQTRDGQSKPE